MSLSPQIKFVSPLKPKTALDGVVTIAPRKLSFCDADVDVAKPTLSQLYHCELDKPPQFDPENTFFTLREAVEKIEAVIHTCQSRKLCDYWRGFVSDVLATTLPHNQKMAELGTILFYLDKDPTNFSALKDVPNLLEYRAKELHKEATDYQQTLAPSMQVSDVASGFAHYLLRALSNMVLTTSSKNRFNRGGLHAVKELLSNPRLLIVQHLQPEHTDHILSIVKELLAKDKYKTFFNQKVQVHETLKDLIRFDIKLPHNSEINSRLVLQDCLMALFTDLRQQDRGNCYAIGAFIYATENHPYKTLQKTIEWLQTGYFHIDGSNIPIRPVLQARLGASSDMDVVVPKEALLQSTAAQHLCETLQLTCPSDDKQEVAQPISKTFENVLAENKASDQKTYVAGMFAGYKYNALVKMHIAACEIASANSIKASDLKNLFVNAVVFAIGKTLSREQADLLRKRLSAELWFQPSYEKTACLGNGNYQSGSDLIHFQESRNALYLLLQYSTRVFQFDGKKYIPLHTISDLRGAVKKIMIDLNIVRTISAESFSKQVAAFCATYINRNLGIHADVLKNADVLILGEKGGCSQLVLNLMYGITASRIELPQSPTPYAFLENLFAQLRTVQLKAASQFPKLLLGSHDHAWTITPSCWKVLNVASFGFKEFVQANVFDLAKRKLKTEISYTFFIRLLAQVHNYVDSNELEEWFDAKEKRTFREVKDILLEKTTTPRRVAEIIDQEFSKVTMSKELLTRTLRVLDVKVTTATFRELYKSLNRDPTTPSTYAQQIRKALLQHNMGTAVLDPYDIEVALTREARHPRAFCLGDLNWADNHSEAPAHQTLRIEYSYADHTLGYYIQRKGLSVRQPNSDYRRMSIYVPK